MHVGLFAPNHYWCALDLVLSIACFAASQCCKPGFLVPASSETDQSHKNWFQFSSMHLQPVRGLFGELDGSLTMVPVVDSLQKHSCSEGLNLDQPSEPKVYFGKTENHAKA